LGQAKKGGGSICGNCGEKRKWSKPVLSKMPHELELAIMLGSKKGKSDGLAEEA